MGLIDLLLKDHLWSKLLVAIACAWLVFSLIRRFLRRHAYFLPNGPRGLPILGRLFPFEFMTLFNHRDLYGDVSYMNVFGNDIVVLNSVESIREAFTGSESAENLDDRPETNVNSVLSNFSISFQSPSVPYWKQRRHIATSLLKQHGLGMEELEKVIGNELAHLCGQLEVDIGWKINMIDYVKPFAINVMITLMIGERYDYSHPLIWKIGRGNELGFKLATPFVDNVLKMFPVVRFLPVSIGRSIKEYISLHEDILSHIYHAQKQLPDDEIQSRKGMVFDLIRLQKKETWLNDDRIKGIVQDLFAAGIATTTASLVSLFLILLKHPEIQTRIQSEIDKSVGKDRRPMLSDLQNMPYTRAVILELLRYTSVVPLSIPHSCSKDMTISGYTIPAGSIVLPNLFRVNHDKENLDKPWEFNPHRFLDDSGELLPASHPIRRNIILFGIGKRACIGEVFAKTRIFLFVVYLLQRFTFLPAGDTSPSCDPRDYVRDFVLNPLPYQLMVERRK